MKNKRIISILLVLTLCLSLMSALALAEEEPVTEAPAQEDILPAEAEVPAEESEAPVEAVEVPAEETEAPAGEAEAPAEEAEEPSEEDEAPAEETEEPAEESEEPVEASEEPVEEDGAPAVDLHSDIHSASGTFKFPSTFNQEYVTARYSYNDAMFNSASSVYNHDLAKMSLSMSLASFNSLNDRELFKTAAELDRGEAVLSKGRLYDADKLGSTPADAVVKLMKDCGFTNIALNRDYLIDTEYHRQYNQGNNIGVCIGAKALEDGTTLIAVAIRSGRYGDEWIGNFTMYTYWEPCEHHRGFNEAAETVYNTLMSYIDVKNLFGNNKIWLSGYSRGGAVANLTAARLCKPSRELQFALPNLKPTDIYTYTFESPLTTKDTNHSDADYNGIWNIVNPIDVMTQVPPAGWDYARYGNNLYLPAENYEADLYGDYADAVLADYNRLRSESNSGLVEVPLQAYAGRRLFDSVLEAKESGKDVGKSDADGLAQTIERTLGQHFKDHEYSTNTGFGEVILALPQQLRGPMKQLGLKADYVLDHFADVIVGHYPESTLAWMDSIPASALKDDAVSRYLKVDGASDYEIYDGEGALQATVSGGKVTLQKDAVIQAIVDTDGKVVISVPQDREAHIRALADKASVSVTATEFSLGDNAFGAPATENKTVKAGEVFQVDVSEDSAGSDCSIVTPLEGDLNADGKVDRNDVAVILRHAVGIGSAKLAGSLTVSDAAAMLKG